MNLWLEVVQLASTIVFADEEDSLIWMFNSNGVYFSQPLYKIINFRGIMPVYVPAVWNLKIPPRVHFFLWLLSQNKVLTRDNLSVRKKVDDKTCLFCKEHESVAHLFFDCVVAKQLWCNVSEILGRNVGLDFLSIGQMWLSNKRFLVENTFCADALWGLWKLRNSLCFQGSRWKNEQCLLVMVHVMLQGWAILCPAEKRMEYHTKLLALKALISRPLRVGWRT